MLGKHCLKAWSKTQSIIAKSSGESELFGVIRGSTEGLGLATMAADFGEKMDVRVHVDANAAKGMVERRGLSRVRHIEVDNLWIQEKEARRMLPLSKVAGGENPADLMTKNVSIDLAKKHLQKMGIRFSDGRSESAANLHMIDYSKKRPAKNAGRESPSGWTPARTIGESDRWKEKDGEECINMIRVHSTPRTELYTPGGDEMKNLEVKSHDLNASRITKGKTSSGKEFEIEDNWKRPDRAHRELGELWTGHTEFTIKASARQEKKVLERRAGQRGRGEGLVVGISSEAVAPLTCREVRGGVFGEASGAWYSPQRSDPSIPRAQPSTPLLSAEDTVSDSRSDPTAPTRMCGSRK